MLEDLSIRLPMPPSINGAYLNVPGRGRVATAVLRSWKAAASIEIRRAIPAAAERPVFRGCVQIAIRLPVPARGEPDADNRVKPVQDALVAAGIIADDSWRYVASSAACWVYDGSLGDRIEVTVSQIAKEPATRAKAPQRASAGVRKETAVTGQRREPEALSSKDARSCAEADTAGRTATKRPSLASTQRPQALPALEAPRHSQKRPSPKASSVDSDAAVRNAIASRLGIDPGRVHLTGGKRGESDKIC